MWIILAFISATLLGLYDVAKKQALKANAVLKVLLLNTVFSTIIFSPTLLKQEGLPYRIAPQYHKAKLL